MGGITERALSDENDRVEIYDGEGTSSPLASLVTTDSIEATAAVRVAHNIRQISVAPLLGEAVRRISEERSVSSLFG